jgi:hypothetical protein
MPESAGECHHDGCTRRRTAYSVFCEEHHREQLERVGLISDVASDPASIIRKRCERLLQAFNQNILSREELCSGLFDHFVHDGMKVGSENWGEALAALPHAVLLDLLAYARERTEPRLFAPFPSDPQKREALEQTARVVQAKLVKLLEELAV